ncbi:MAG TPA: glycerol-3-phosphate 1-O-acyltransferase PlsY [Verrucomicrobiae bacterium]|nr:glycerol-3-phosphate 1-O-acyltransferase PlsY [Verrucomicrobiae bacterium]
MGVGRVAAVGFGYGVGSVPTGVLVGRLLAGVDVRRYGSHSSGATNVLRTAGPVAGVATLCLDAAKGYLAPVVVRRLGGGQAAQAAAAAAAGVGHSWPAFAGFQGGRSVMTTIGSLLALEPGTAGLALLGGVPVIALTRYVSLGSLAGALTAAAVAVRSPRVAPSVRRYTCFAAALLVVRHRGNIARLARGQEHRLGDR